MLRNYKKALSHILVIMMICNISFCFTGCGNKELTNAYINHNINSATINSENMVSVTDISEAEAFSNDKAVLTDDFKSAFDVSSDAYSMLLVNNDTNEILYSKNSMKEMPNASTTKLMTAYIVLTEGNLDDYVTVSHDISLEDGAVALYLAKGDKIQVKELLYGLLLESANDCAVVLAEYISGSVSEFAIHMNEVALKLGASHSHFMNPHGLDDPDHYSCAYDLYLILKADMAIDTFTEITTTKTHNVVFERDGDEISTEVTCTNAYVNEDVKLPMGFTVLGGKTGTTTNAGHCLTLCTENADGEQIIGIVLNAVDTDSLYETMTGLITEGK